MGIKKERLLECVKKILAFERYIEIAEHLPELQKAYDEYMKHKCNCKSGMDVKDLCEPECLTKNSLKQFQKCPMRLSTMNFWICNQTNLYERAVRYDFSFLERYGLPKEENRVIMKTFMEENITNVIN